MPTYNGLLKKQEISILISVILLIAIFSIVNPKFLSVGNITVILRSGAFIGIVSIGIAFVLMSGSIDLSVGSMAGFANIITSYLAVLKGYPPYVSILIGLLAGVVVGAINYFLIYKVKIPAFLSTIGMLYILRGMSQFISNGYTIYPLPEFFKFVGEYSIYGISLAFIIFIVLIVISELTLNNTVWGLCVRAVGSDRETARNLEVNIDKISLSVFIISGVLSSLAGILLMSRIITGQPSMGSGWELQSITACAIGGVSLFGYDGSFIGVLLGVLAIQIISNGLVISGVSVYLQNVVVGIILLVITALDFQRREKLNLGV